MLEMNTIESLLLLAELKSAVVLEDAWESPLEKCHDWRNHAKAFRDLWPQLLDETRLAVFVLASRAANNEEWD